MALSGFGFDNEENQSPMSEINTTPLVDVMLVLLVIFLVTAPMLTQGIKMELPNDKAEALIDSKPIVISIDNTGNYYWNNNMVATDKLQELFASESLKSTKTAIHLKADKLTPYQNVSRLLSLAQEYKMTNVSFLTERR